MFIQRKRVVADTELDDEMLVDEMDAGEGEVEVAPEATDLLFEAEDVAELVAEVTGQPVEVTADENEVVFAVGDDEFTVQAEGDEELLEAATRIKGRKKAVAASRKVPAKKTVAASTRTIRKVPSKRK